MWVVNQASYIPYVSAFKAMPLSYSKHRCFPRYFRCKMTHPLRHAIKVKVHTILANPPVFPGKIPENQHSSRGPGDFKQTPGKTKVLSDTGFSWKLHGFSRMSRFLKFFQRYVRCSFALRTVHSTLKTWPGSRKIRYFTTPWTWPCKICTDKVTGGRRLIKLHYSLVQGRSVLYAQLQSRTFFWREKLFFTCFCAIQGFWEKSRDSACLVKGLRLWWLVSMPHRNFNLNPLVHLSCWAVLLLA